MASVHCLMVIICFLAILSSYQLTAQPQTQPSSSSVSAARLLDALLQDYAYRAFNLPRTGVQYEGHVPSHLSGIRVSAIRLRSGSLRYRGIQSFNEFEIPVGVMEQPYVQRLALVYQNLGNWSSVYYQLPGYTFVAPVLGLLAYDAANISATNLPEIDIQASVKPISIRFKGVSRAASSLTTKCVWFNLDGLSKLNDSAPGNICTAYRQGHFAIVVNSSELASAPSPSRAPVNPKKSNSKTWKVVIAAIGGFLALLLLLLLVVWIKRYRKNKKMEKMIQHAESGEVLEKHRIRDAHLPRASAVRTRPTLESDLTAHVTAAK